MTIEIIRAASDDGLDVLEAACQNIERYPGLHNQGIWRNECGTGGCLAGWMVEAHPNARWDGESYVRVTGDGEFSEWIQQWGADVLEVPGHDVGTLFAGDLERGEVLARARRFIELRRAGEDPEAAMDIVWEEFHRDDE